MLFSNCRQLIFILFTHPQRGLIPRVRYPLQRQACSAVSLRIASLVSTAVDFFIFRPELNTARDSSRSKLHNEINSSRSVQSSEYGIRSTQSQDSTVHSQNPKTTCESRDCVSAICECKRLTGWECLSWRKRVESSEMMTPWMGALQRSGFSWCPCPYITVPSLQNQSGCTTHTPMENKSTRASPSNEPEY